MEHVLVRYSEIGTKSQPVRGKMLSVLRQRVEDRLEHEDIDYEAVRRDQGRITVEAAQPVKAAGILSTVPGVASTSPAKKVPAEIEAVKEAAESFDYGATFGVDARRAGEHDFSSIDIEVELGSRIEEITGSEVDLDDPDTWLRVEVRFGDAYVFTEKFEGPGGFPVGSQGSYAALISGGIDSPVAAHEVMTRGADIVPVYFYNKPVAAEDHLLRFEETVNRLKKFHPSKKWSCYVVDMEEVNRELMKVERGRMLLHRIVMFRVAEKIAEDEGLDGLVTGEALGQKSSQTSSSLELTSGRIKKPVLRPLLTRSKDSITGAAKEIGTYEIASIDSACSTMAPDSPATSMRDEDLEELEEKTGIDDLVVNAFSEAERRVF